jgi:hypothetical protein
MLKSGFSRLVGFLLITTLLALGLHISISWSLKRVSVGDYGAFNRAMQGRVNAEVLVTGSSRAFRHYDPRILSGRTGLSCFNLGLNGSQIDVQLGALKAYLRQNKKPRLLIQNLDIQSLILTKPTAIFDPAQYVPYLGDTELYSCLDRIDGDLWKWKYLPLYAYAVKDTSFTWTVGLRHLVGLGPRDACYDGFSPVARSWTNDFERFRRANPQGLEIEIDAGGVAALQGIIELCQKEGIQMALVYSPQYFEMIRLTRNRARIFALFRSIAQRGNVRFIDYTDSPISFNREWFYNSQHLNARGAEVFTQDLATRLVAMGFVARSSESRTNAAPSPEM